MKKLMKRIPRPLLVLIHIAVTLLCILMIYIILGSPSFTAEMQYRRLEKSHIVDPATILGTETVSGKGKILIAKSDTQLMLFFYNDGIIVNSTDLLIRDSYGDLTILPAVELLSSYTERKNYGLPIILFDTYPQAVRAELRFTMLLETYKNNSPELTIQKESFILKATRTNDGYFRFNIEHSNHMSKMLETLANASRGYNNDDALIAEIPFSVRLYDANDQLITDQIIYFHPITEDLSH